VGAPAHHAVGPDGAGEDADAVAVALVAARGLGAREQVRNIQLAQASEAVGHDVGLVPALGGGCQVLQVAAAALAVVGAGGLDPVRTGLQHLQQLGLGETLLLLGEACRYQVARRGQGHEDGPALVAGQAGAAGDQLVDAELEHGVGRVRGGVLQGVSCLAVGSASKLAWGRRRDQRRRFRPGPRKPNRREHAIAASP